MNKSEAIKRLEALFPDVIPRGEICTIVASLWDEAREIALKEAANECDEWADAVKKVGSHKHKEGEIFAYQNAATTLRSMTSDNSEHNESKLNDDGTLYECTLHVGGKPYHCTCGCNVFHHPDKDNLNIYRCNACQTTFKAE